MLEVIYLMFNEGYRRYTGDHLIREDLCREALRLGQLVANNPHMSAPEAHALVALMAFQTARQPARIDSRGEMVLLEDQDRRYWSPQLTALAFAHFERSARGHRLTAYHIQAGIASMHACAPDAASTDWAAILALYDDLLRIAPSPVAALNRIVAVAKVRGPLAALGQLADLERQPALADYYLLPAVKGRLLSELGDHAGAAAVIERHSGSSATSRSAGCSRDASPRPSSVVER